MINQVDRFTIIWTRSFSTAFKETLGRIHILFFFSHINNWKRHGLVFPRHTRHVGFKNRRPSVQSVSSCGSQKEKCDEYLERMRHCSPPDADKLRRFHWLLTNITGSSVFIAYDCRYDCVVSFYKVFNQPAYLGLISFFLQSDLGKNPIQVLVWICLVSKKKRRILYRQRSHWLFGFQT